MDLRQAWRPSQPLMVKEFCLGWACFNRTDPNRPFGSVWIGFISKKTSFGLLDCKPTSLGLDFGLEGFQTDLNRSNLEILYNYIIF